MSSEYSFHLWHEHPDGDSPSPWSDLATARQLLQGLRNDPMQMMALRRTVQRSGLCADLSHVSEERLLEQVAGLIASGGVRVSGGAIGQRAGAGGGGGGAPPAPPPAPKPPKPSPGPKPAPKKVANLHVQLQHQCDKSPLSGGTVKISGPESKEAKTGGDGWAKFDGIAPGKYDIKGTHPKHRDGTASADAPADATTERQLPLEAVIEIAAVKAEYTVVLDKTGAVPAAHPILELKITNGPPNHLFDVQISRTGAGSLSGGPGLSDSWVSTDARDVRLTRTVYSSWSDGQKTLKLDGAGAATFKMPLEWWRDQARRKLADFTEQTFHFRVVAMKDAATPMCAIATAGSVKLRNNLTLFRVVDLGYTAGGTKHSIRMEFTVRETGTTEMYTFVQWMQGSFRQWKGTPPVMSHPTHQLYGIIHDANFPDFTIDRLETNPRYWSGNYNISGDGLTASATDAPGGPIDAGFSHDHGSVDFETRVHLNFEVPAAVKVTRKDGSAPVFGVVTGVLDDPQPITLSSTTWNMRVLQVRAADGTVTVTHPNTFAGP